MGSESSMNNTQLSYNNASHTHNSCILAAGIAPDGTRQKDASRIKRMKMSAYFRRRPERQQLEYMTLNQNSDLDTVNRAVVKVRMEKPPRTHKKPPRANSKAQNKGKGKNQKISCA